MFGISLKAGLDEEEDTIDKDPIFKYLSASAYKGVHMFDNQESAGLSGNATTGVASGLSVLSSSKAAPMMSYISVQQVENGFTISSRGVIRVYTNFDDAVADMKTYFAV